MSRLILLSHPLLSSVTSLDFYHMLSCSYDPSLIFLTLTTPFTPLSPSLLLSLTQTTTIAVSKTVKFHTVTSSSPGRAGVATSTRSQTTQIGSIMDETLSEIATGETPFDLDVEEDPLEPAMDDPLDLDIDEAILDAAMEDAIEPAMEDAVEPAIEEPIEQPTEDDPPVEPPAEDPPVEAPVDDGMSYRNRRGVYKIEKYRSCEVIIIDQIRRDDATNSELLKHYKMNEKVARFFRKYTNYRVRVLRFPEGSRPRDWDQFWKGKLREKREGDLLVLYFHGRARGLGDKWEWYVYATQFTSQSQRI